MGIVVVKQWASFAYNNGHRFISSYACGKVSAFLFPEWDIISEQRELHDAVASFCLVLGNVDALRHEVVCRCRQGAAMGELFYAVEAVFGHLVRGYEYGLCLPLTPLIESFVVETFCLVIYVGVFVWNIAIYHAVFGYRDFFVVKHRGCNR